VETAKNDVPFASTAENVLGENDFLGFSIIQIFQGDLHVVNNILTAAFAAATIAAASAEHAAAKETFEKIKGISTRSSGSTALQTLLSILIINLSLVRVAERLIRFADLLELYKSNSSIKRSSKRLRYKY
jgi:hypothetical protein